MVDITQIDHVEEGLNKLPSQWKNSPNLIGLLESYLTPLNTSEENLLGVRDGFNIATAIGAQLDIIGAYFKESRLGRTDGEYRAAIQTIISSSNGSGTPNELMGLFSTLAGTGEIGYWEHWPYGIMMLATGGEVATPSHYNNIKSAMPACTELMGLMYDPIGFAWTPVDGGLDQLNLVVAPSGDQLVTDVPDNITVVTTTNSVSDGNFRSSFTDVSVDAGTAGGYGNDYGLAYGAAPRDYSELVDTVTEGNLLVTSGGNGFVEWAGDSEYDGENEVEREGSGTTNKAKPTLQYQNSGILSSQPLPRQFFNWMMAKIDDWFKFISDRTTIGTFKYTVDAARVVGYYNTKFDGTWTPRGSQSLGTETVYIFERTA